MLIAKNQEGNLVLALETCLKRKESYSCPGCQGVVLLRHGQVMCPHFAHKSLQDCQFFSENDRLNIYRLRQPYINLWLIMVKK